MALVTLEELLARYGRSRGALASWLEVFSHGASQVNASSFRFLLEEGFSLGPLDIRLHPALELTDEQLRSIYQALRRMSEGEPLAYVLGHEVFLGRCFLVDKRVLIPRPETEELVLLLKEAYGQKASSLRVLDCGTGSGCIGISVALEMPKAKVTALDKSQGALDVAAANAARLSAEVSFLQGDLSRRELYGEVGKFDVIVSNPPYIPAKDVEGDLFLAYEPSMALVAQEDGLFFYGMFARFGGQMLLPGGAIFLEIGHDQGEAVKKLFQAEGWCQVLVRKDMFGKDRFVTARLS